MLGYFYKNMEPSCLVSAVWLGSPSGLTGVGDIFFGELQPIEIPQSLGKTLHITSLRLQRQYFVTTKLNDLKLFIQHANEFTVLW